MSPWPIRIFDILSRVSCGHVQIILPFVQVIVSMNKLVLSSEAISIAVRDFLKKYHIFMCTVC